MGQGKWDKGDGSLSHKERYGGTGLPGAGVRRSRPRQEDPVQHLKRDRGRFTILREPAQMSPTRGNPRASNRPWGACASSRQFPVDLHNL